MHSLIDGIVATGSGAFQAGAPLTPKPSQLVIRKEHSIKWTNSQLTGCTTPPHSPSEQNTVHCLNSLSMLPTDFHADRWQYHDEVGGGDHAQEALMVIQHPWTKSITEAPLTAATRQHTGFNHRNGTRCSDVVLVTPASIKSTAIASAAESSCHQIDGRWWGLQEVWVHPCDLPLYIICWYRWFVSHNRGPGGLHYVYQRVSHFV